MEFLKVESIVPFNESNPFLLSWLRSGKRIEILFFKQEGEGVRLYFGGDCRDLLKKSGWKISETFQFNESGKRVFVKGDSQTIRFGSENHADKIAELLNEEETGFLLISLIPHYFSPVSNKEQRVEDKFLERKAKERKGWRVELSYRNENLGNYLSHVFSSPKVVTRRGRFGISRPVIAWWEVNQFIPTSTHSLKRGDVRVGSTPNRGEIFVDTNNNPHTLISGSSGAGKSSMIVGMMNHILFNKLGKVILIDPHGDTSKKMEESAFRKFVISPDSANSINVIGVGRANGITYKVAEEFVSILRSSREIQYTDPLVGPRMEDLISRGISLLGKMSGATLVDFYNILREADTRKEIASTCNNNELRKFLDELGGMSREELASTERAIGRLVNDPMVRSLICNPDDDGTLSNALAENDLILIDLERSSLGYEDSRLMSNIMALHIWFAITSSRNGNYFLFLEEAQDYQSTLIADMLSSGRKFGLRIFFLTTSFKSIIDRLTSLFYSNISNYIFMKLTDPDKIKAKELIATDIEMPNESFDFVLINPYGKERGSVEPVRFSRQTKEFIIRNYDFISERKKRNLSLQIDDLISQMKTRETTFFVLEEFCQVLDGYDRREVITLLKEKINRDQSIHYVGRISLDSGTFEGRHECFQVAGERDATSNLPNEFKVTSDLISNLLVKK